MRRIVIGRKPDYEEALYAAMETLTSRETECWVFIHQMAIELQKQGHIEEGHKLLNKLKEETK